MAQQPAVVIVARHGPRLDAADSKWHLSTPTAYDPPLTYGGWNQTRALGARIASLLHAREQNLNATGDAEGVTSHDFTGLDEDGKQKDSGTEERPKKRRRVKHRVVIHSSPYLRCIQTSVGIAAGMAQYNPSIDTGSRPSTAGKKMHSASPRLRPAEGHGSPTLGPIAEPRHDLAHMVARKVLHEHKRYRRSKLRVDAFLGEWLNPEYFEHITSPPPSAMMIKTAKAELMQNDTVEIFTPAATTNSTSNSLWGGGSGSSGARTPSRENTTDDWSEVQDSLPTPPSPTRSRASTQNSIGGSESGRRSPFRPGSTLQPLTSIIPKQETAIYHPPTPHYAISSSDQIPRGYVAHARNACTDVDLSWDSMRPPQNFGDGGELGEEWSSMHKRFRRGLNRMIYWYTQHESNHGDEDALGFDQAESNGDEEEQEDLVVILVTHGAGCNALIGALTGQPVLLDVGMASLTMAVRKDDAPQITTYASSTPPSEKPTPRHSPSPEKMNGSARRGSLDMGLNSIYEMKLTAANEHLRPGVDPTKLISTSNNLDPKTARDSLSMFRQRSQTGSEPTTHRFGEPPRSNTSSALGTIRRPSAANYVAAEGAPRSSSLPRNAGLWQRPEPAASTGLWTPPSGRTPVMQAQSKLKEEQSADFSSLDERGSETRKSKASGDSMVLDFSSSPADSRPSTSDGAKDNTGSGIDGTQKGKVMVEPPTPAKEHPASPNGQTTPSGLWGAKPSGDKLDRATRQEPKRRWTVDDRDPP